MLLSFFLILNGGRKSGTLTKFYWLKANTLGYNDASRTTKWYNYMFCGYQDGSNNLFNCSSKAPAKPFSPRDNFGASPNMASSFLNNRDTYYYLSRVAWAMLLIGVFFQACCLIPSLLSIFKLLKPMALVNLILTWISFFFIILAACLYTGCYVKAKKAFHSQNRMATLGSKNFGILWTTVFLLLCCAIWNTVSLVLLKKKQKRDNLYVNNTANNYIINNPDEETLNNNEQKSLSTSTSSSNTGQVNNPNLGTVQEEPPMLQHVTPPPPDVVKTNINDTNIRP